MDPANRLHAISITPHSPEDFDEWLKAADAIGFLEQNAGDAEFLLYAARPHVFMNTVAVPLSFLNPPDKADLMEWNYGPTSSWGIDYDLSSSPAAWISSPLNYTGSKTIDRGEQLFVSRHFEGHLEEKNYIEFLQKFTHVFDLHYLHEQQSYCRLGNKGDLDPVIRIANSGEGTVVTCRRDLLFQYAAVTDSAFVRMFDFTRWRETEFKGWGVTEPVFTDAGNIFYRQVVQPEHASYTRGCQIVYSDISKQDVAKIYATWGHENRKYESFVAFDWKNNVVKEVSTAPGATANYFTESDLPYEISPVFFSPEVLLRYKNDSEKYQIEDRSIRCRGTWRLQRYDVNEAGQLHVYLVDLRQLPHEEQLYWKVFNEEPKGPISRRAFKNDFEGTWDHEYEPLESLKYELRRLDGEKPGWWILRSGELLNRVHYPATKSPDEWANELLNLDQLIIEGLEKKWLRRKAEKLGRVIEPQLGSLKVIEEYLIGIGYEEEDARQVTAPLHQLHELRSKLKGHAPGREAVQIRKRTLKEHGTYVTHFHTLVARCDESIRELSTAFFTRAARDKGTEELK